MAKPLDSASHTCKDIFIILRYKTNQKASLKMIVFCKWILNSIASQLLTLLVLAKKEKKGFLKTRMGVQYLPPFDVVRLLFLLTRAAQLVQRVALLVILGFLRFFQNLVFIFKF